MDKTTGLAIWVVLALLIGGILTYAIFPQTITVEKEVPTEVPVYIETPYNDTAIKNDLTALKDEVLADSNWKTEAKELATIEWTERSYKDLYNALVDLNVSIVDKEDISSVVEKDITWGSIDADEKDAILTQNLKVYYEDSTGEKLKIYMDVVTTITENDVIDQVFTLV